MAVLCESLSSGYYLDGQVNHLSI